jgi:hypothetical protein
VQAVMAAVNRNMFDASVPVELGRGQGASIMTLPLNLIAHLISYVSWSANQLN